MTGKIEIFHYGVLIYQERFRLWEIEEMSWEDKAKSRERQYKIKTDRLIKSMPFYDPDLTKIYVTYKSKMNNDHTNWVLQRSIDNAGGDHADIASSIL